MMGTSDEMKELLVKGTFRSYENCVYLAGIRNVGKSTLASILVGEKIPTEWISTDGLNINFGRNGINLKTREMVPLKLNQGNTSKHLVNILQNGQKSLKISYCYNKYFS
jgi:ribosome biogenesis GTPase A